MEMMDVCFIRMASLTPVSLFVAATSLLITPDLSVVANAEDNGGLLEWNTDQSIDAESRPDADAAAIQQQAEQEDVCVPIGEGENCW